MFGARSQLPDLFALNGSGSFDLVEDQQSSPGE
jgi:hypothetical protein